jgi:rSAM/selenodomain-associated transferase 1
MSTERLAVFVRAPVRGAVKTRLAATLGDQAALAAYEELLTTLCTHLSPLPPRSIALHHTPDDGAPALSRWLQPGWSVRPQGDGTLGDRLSRAVLNAFGEGVQRLVIIGSDCPDVQQSDIREAWRALDTHDVVLGPAEDGGYWAIGLRLPCVALFREIAWSSAEVLQQTLARCRDLHLSVHTLRPLRDIDTQADWEVWRAAKVL